MLGAPTRRLKSAAVSAPVRTSAARPAGIRKSLLGPRPHQCSSVCGPERAQPRLAQHGAPRPLPLADDPVPPPSPSHTHSSACSSRSLAHEGGDLHSLSSRGSDWSSSSSDGAEEAFDMVSSAELPPPVAAGPSRDEAQQNARSLSPGSAASSDAGGRARSPQRMRLSFPDPLETSLSPAEQEQEPARGHEREGARSILLDGEGAYSLLLDAPSPASHPRERERTPSFEAHECGSGLTSPLLRAQEGEGDVEGVEEWVRRMRDAQDDARECEGRRRTERGVQATLGEAGGAAAAEDEGVVVEKAAHADAPPTKSDLAASAALLSASVASTTTTTTMASSSLVSSQATVVPSTLAAAPVALAVAARTATPTPSAVTAAETKPAARPPLASQRGPSLAYRAFVSFCVLSLVAYCLSAVWLDGPPGLRAHPRQVVREVRVEVVAVETPDQALAMRGEMMGESAATGAAFGGEKLEVQGLPTDTTVQIDFVPACATPTASPGAAVVVSSAPPVPTTTRSAASDSPAVVQRAPAASAATPVLDPAADSPSTATHSPCAACALATLPAAHPPAPLARMRHHSKRCAHARERRRPRVIRRGEKGASKEEGQRVSLFRETGPSAERAGLASLAELALAARQRVRDVRDLQAHARAILRAEEIIGAVDAVSACGGSGVARAARWVRTGGGRMFARLERFASLRPELLGNKLDRMTVTAHDRDSLIAIAQSLGLSRVAQIDAALGRSRALLSRALARPSSGAFPAVPHDLVLAVPAPVRRAARASALLAGVVSDRAGSAARGGKDEGQRHVFRAART
ncbi:hypothetical protein JCM10450v2_007267, partial [Rhodotorula kratochvilovae]